VTPEFMKPSSRHAPFLPSRWRPGESLQSDTESRIERQLSGLEVDEELPVNNQRLPDVKVKVINQVKIRI